MLLPPEKIEEIRNSNDIIELIGTYIKLKKRGKNYIGLCPFHNEKTPSFSVSPDKQMYHCFGCGAGGNIITFMMEFEKVSFIEAVRSLAERAGISLPQYSHEEDEQAKKQEELYSVCREVGLFFYKNLTETVEGKFAIDYFHKRGFDDDTIRIFGLGYSLNSWDSLVKHAEAENIPLESLEKSGLLRKREDGTYYDYFRGRAMFPIFSTTGRVVGFGARKLYEDDQLGKYINSPETLIYNKSRILYGISHAKETIRENDFTILVEGYVDLIRIYQEGIKNVVASSGTALTVEQIQLIGRYTKNITIVYDADSAGSKAALRGVDLILENDLDVNVAVLPQGEDPDSYIEKYGGEKILNLIKNSVSFVDFMAQAFEREGYLKTPEGQTKAVRAIIQTIAKMRDGIKRNFYIKSVAEKYKLYESVLHQELENYIKIDRKRAAVQTSTPEISEIPLIDFEMEDFKTSPSANAIKKIPDEVPVAEKDLIHAIIDGGNEIAAFVFQYISPDNFIHPYTKLLANQIEVIYNTDKNIDAAVIIDSLSKSSEISQEDIAKIKNLAAELVFSKYELSKRWEESGTDVTKGEAAQIARDAIKSIYKQSIQKKLEQNQFLMKEASKRGEDLSPYLLRNNELINEKRFIESDEFFSNNI